MYNNNNNNRLRNPFDDDDRNSRFGNNNSASSNGNDDEEFKRIQEQIGHVENESLSSTQRALRALNETEEVGAKTAEELVAQGEKLQNIEEAMDGVNSKLNATQKNINQLKGFFGGMKVQAFRKFSANNNNKMNVLIEYYYAGDVLGPLRQEQEWIEEQSEFEIQVR